MSYVLYGSRQSGSLAVELALAEIGVDYDIHDISLDASAQREPAYAAVNPQRKIPALKTPTGETLTESAAILLTLAECHPDAGLMPPLRSADRAAALSALLFVATELYPLIEINDYPERFSPGPESVDAVREIARQKWRERWLIVEDRVTGDSSLLGSGFCVVDIYIAVVSRWAQQATWRPSHIPKIERITAEVASRPKLASVWSRHQAKKTPGIST